MPGLQDGPGDGASGGGGQAASAPGPSSRARHDAEAAPGAPHRDGDDIQAPPAAATDGLEERWRAHSSAQVADYEAFRVRQDRVTHPVHGGELCYHSVDVPPGVLVVPVTADGRVVMIEQYRHAVRRVCLEFPAGMLEGEEAPETAGPRELEEETGYRPGRVERLATLDPDPSVQSNSTCVLLALDCQDVGGRDEDDGEEVVVHSIEADEVTRLVERGALRHGLSVAAWGLYERWRARQSGS